MDTAKRIKTQQESSYLLIGGEYISTSKIFSLISELTHHTRIRDGYEPTRVEISGGIIEYPDIPNESYYAGQKIKTRLQQSAQARTQALRGLYNMLLECIEFRKQILKQCKELEEVVEEKHFPKYELSDCINIGDDYLYITDAHKFLKKQTEIGAQFLS